MDTITNERAGGEAKSRRDMSRADTVRSELAAYLSPGVLELVVRAVASQDRLRACENPYPARGVGAFARYTR